MHTWRYSLFGFELSANVPIPGLVPADAVDIDSPLIRLTMGVDRPLPAPPTPPWFTSRSDQDGNGLRVWQQGTDRFRFHYADGTVFDLADNGLTITAAWPASLTLADTTAYLCGHIMGFILGRHGRFCLHASVIVLDGRAVGLMAPAGGGKSTTAAAFACRGIPVLSDDILAIRDTGGRFMAQPGYPRIKLWASSVSMLGLSDTDLPRISPTHPKWDKRYLDLSQRADVFHASPAPLAAIYSGEATVAPTREPDIRPVSKAEAVPSLLANRYRFPLASRRERMAEFDWAHRLADCTPMRRIRYHRGSGTLPRLCKAIEADLSDAVGRAA